MKIEEIRKDDVIQDWLDTLNPRPNTVKNYLNSMMWYTEWAGKTPLELIEEAEADIKAGKLMRERAIKKLLPGFRRHMQDKGRAPITVKNYLTGIKSFYASYDIELPKMSRNGAKARPLEKNLDIPTIEDIRTILRVSDPLERAVVLVGVASGLTTSELIRLTVGQFLKGYDPITGITILRVRREKAQTDFYTFLTPEASQAVFEYLRYRERQPKKNSIDKRLPREKQRVTSDTDTLFITRRVDDRYLETRDENLRRFDSHSLTKLYRIISAKADKCTPSGDWNLIRAHNFRKYFNSAMLNAGADSFFVEYCMGHTLDDTRSAYFRATPEKLKEIYQKFVPYLTIQKELNISESPEYIQIKRENEILHAETAKHIVERSEISELKAQLEEMQKLQTTLNLIMENPEIQKKLAEKMK